MLHSALTYAGLAVLPIAGGAIAATATSDSSGLAPYVGGSAALVLAGGLTEVTRRLLNGRLIPRETRDAEAETAAYIVAAGQREDRAMKVVEDTGRQIAVLARAIEDLHEEIRRERRER